MSECKHAPRKDLISEINQCHLEQEKYEKELFELQAQVAVLRGALERLTETIDDQIPLGGYCEEIDLNVDVMLEPWASLFDAKGIADAALLLTPSDAAERVQELVEALEEVEKMGTYKNADFTSEDSQEEPWAVIAGNALSEWRRDK